MGWRLRRSRHEREELVLPVPILGIPDRLTRDDCPTCNAKRDALGRPPVGFCGPKCLGRTLLAITRAGQR